MRHDMALVPITGDLTGNGGDVGYTMDYYFSGDACGQVYMYDGSPVIAFQDMGSYYVYYSMYSNTLFTPLPGQRGLLSRVGQFAQQEHADRHSSPRTELVHGMGSSTTTNR